MWEGVCTSSQLYADTNVPVLKVYSIKFWRLHNTRLDSRGNASVKLHHRVRWLLRGDENNQVHRVKISGGMVGETWVKCNLIRFRNFGPRNWQKCGPGVNGVIRLICVISLLPEAEEKPEPRIAVVCQFWVCTQPSLSSAQSAQSLEMLSQAM